MTAAQLYQQGKLAEAIQALGVELRDNPGDAKRRTFLFELLCFAGEWDRAEKHLHVLAKEGGQAELGAVLYFAALHAERTRAEKFAAPIVPAGAPPREELTGKLNGQPFTFLSDGDARLSARLEIYAAGAYLWLPFEHIERLEIDKPKRVRDLLWAQAFIQTGPGFKGTELGEVLVPMIYAGSARHPDENVRLGRTTVVEEREGLGVVPFGQKLLLADDEEIPYLEIRSLEIDQEAVSEQHAVAG